MTEHNTAKTSAASEDLISEKTSEREEPSATAALVDNCQEHQSTEFGLKHFLKGFFKWTTIRLILSHHPFCEKYESHVFKIGPVRLCRGCLLSYPPAYAFIFTFIFWEAFRLFFVSADFLIMNHYWFMIGLTFVAVIGRIIGRKVLFIKDISKVARGLLSGMALILAFIPVHWSIRLGSGLLLVAGLLYISYRRMKDTEKTCDECSWESRFEVCPGWRDLYANLGYGTQPSECPETPSNCTNCNPETEELAEPLSQDKQE